MPKSSYLVPLQVCYAFGKDASTLPKRNCIGSAGKSLTPQKDPNAMSGGLPEAEKMCRRTAMETLTADHTTLWQSPFDSAESSVVDVEDSSF